MHEPLKLGDETNHHYLVVDVHGFDGERGLITELKPVEDRGRPSEAPVRIEVVSGITIAEFACFANSGANLATKNWRRLDQGWFSWTPLDSLPWAPPIREEMISKVDILPGLPPNRGLKGHGKPW